MTIDIEKLIEEVDEDGSGEIEFEEFKELLKADGGVMWRTHTTSTKITVSVQNLNIFTLH